MKGVDRAARTERLLDKEPTLVRNALNRILESRTFERSERARDMLRYIVEQDLADKGGEIKGFSIGVDVFGKDAGFDPATDPLVRVHAGRLRELLVKYYLNEGAKDPVRIDIPVGKYRPEYLQVEQPPAEPEAGREVSTAAIETDEAAGPGPEPILRGQQDGRKGKAVAGRDDQPRKPRSRLLTIRLPRSWLSGIIIGCLALLGLAYYLGLAGIPWSVSPVEQDDGILDLRASASELPVLHVITNVEDEPSLRFAEQLVHGLSAFDTVTTLLVRPLEVLEKRTDQWSDLEYGLKVTNTGGHNDAGAPTFRIDLLNLLEGTVLRVEEYGADIWKHADIHRLASQKLTSVATPEGVVYADIVARGETNPLLDCMLKVRNYYDKSDPPNHQAAFECTKDFSERENPSGLLTAIHGGLVAEAAGKGFATPDVPADREKAMDVALETSLKGIDIDPLSARSAREIGFVYSWQGKLMAMTEWFERASELNPHDTSIAASLGYGLVISGEYENAVGLLDDAVEATPRHPAWWDFYLALALIMEERFEEAGKVITPLEASHRNLLYHMLNAVIAFRKGDRYQAAFSVRQLKEHYPKFAANPTGDFEHRHYPRGLINNLVEALQKSGI